MVDFDYIIVGGGAAGCVVANRLSAQAANRVLLLEAGQDYLPGEEPANMRDTFYTAAYVKKNLWPDTQVHWLSSNAGEKSRPPTFYEQGRVMGGGSSVNAMVALRGMALDFVEWVAAGADGWSWEDVLPYYIKLEADQDFDTATHGRVGAITIRRHLRSEWPPFVEAVARELSRRGYGYLDDVNGGHGEGFGRIPMTNTLKQRVSSAMGYLTPAVRRRENLSIVSGAVVDRLLFEQRQCVGVEAVLERRRKIYRGREIVLCAGTYRTPTLLMHSGIGDADHLSRMQVPIVHDSPGVGANLHDHPTFAAAVHLKLGSTQSRALRPHATAGLFYSSGVANCPPFDMYMPITSKVSWHALGERIGGLFMVLMKPFSRGSVRLQSADPQMAPRIEVRAFDDERDRVRAVQSMRFAADLLGEPSVREHVTESFGAAFSERVSALNTVNRLNGLKAALGELLLDGPPSLRRWLMRNVVCPNSKLETLVSNDDVLESWLRENVTGFFHPVGTCRMGRAGDRLAVTDPVGRVRGVCGLRVADASVMPVIVRATTNLTVIMIGEKMADHILADTGPN